MKNKRIIYIIVSFLLLIPFRLPITILFIKVLNNIATFEGTVISEEILSANVLVTKIIYNIVFSILFIYNIEIESRNIKERIPRDSGGDSTIFWWTGWLIALWTIYLIFDAVYTYELARLIY